jgi:plastocyanin
LKTLSAALAVAGLALTGCAGDSVNDAVEVRTEEMKFLPKTLRMTAGRRTFVVKNTGEIRHTFSLNELGREVTVEPGKTRTFTADLEPGTYRYVCRILDHEGLGMLGTLRVSAS